MNSFEIRVGDARTLLPLIPDASVQCVVTSPPYWGLRDYGVADQFGLEATPEQYVANVVAIFREVRRVLAKDGTLWLNMGDGYTAGGRGGDTGKSGLEGSTTSQDEQKRARGHRGKRLPNGRGDQPAAMRTKATEPPPFAHLAPKQLVGMPWRVALALQADGWQLRADIIWAKPNPMPESVKDRPTKSHEYLFLLSKSRRYFYDAAAVAEPCAEVTLNDRVDTGRFRPDRGFPGSPSAGNGRLGDAPDRNLRSVWTVATVPYPEAHFATFPPKLVEPCVKAGTRPGDLVFDPFAGAGTVGLVALRLGRDFLGLELNPAYAEMARRRILDDSPLLNAEAQP